MDFRTSELEFRETTRRIRDSDEIPTVSNDVLLAVVGRREIAFIPVVDKDNTVLISIAEPNDGNFVTQETKDTYTECLSVEFWDILTPWEIMDTIIYDVIPDAIAKDIRNFIERHKDKQFVIHCKAGVSRSAAVACAIECIVNYNGDEVEYNKGDSEIKSHWRYHPNPTVYDKIMAA